MSKIYFIPRQPIAGPPKMLPVEGCLPDGTKPTLHVKIEEVVVGSHFADMMYFFGGNWSNVEYWTEDSIAMRFWERADLIEWIEANCVRPVIVQPDYRYEQGWQFAFISPEDHNRFKTIVNGGSLRGVFTFDVEERVYNEISDWVQKNLSGPREVRRKGYGSFVGKVRIVVRIKDLAEAAAFKLVWHGEGRDAA